MKAFNKIKFVSVIILLLIFVSFILTSCSNPYSNLLSIHMIDVDQGESILIITPSNKTILIDGGESSQSRKIKSYLTKHRVKKIDLLVATHPHSDHIGGLSDIINNFKVEKIFMPKKIHTSIAFENLLNTIQNKNLNINNPKLNTTMEFDKDINLHFLGPVRDYGENLNLWSIVFRLDFKNKSFLFTGDMEKEAENDLINKYGKEYLKANVLKVGHHGSNTSSSEVFLRYTNPEVAIISVGNNNPYGHPHRDIIERLENHRILIYRTDIQNNVVLLSDGIEIWSNQTPTNRKYNSQKLP